MSAPCFGWAIERGRELSLPTSERFVLAVLSNRANGSMVCWPSLPTIAADTGLSPRTVFSAVHRLAELRLISISMRGRCLEYRILRANAEPEPSQPLQGSEPAEAEPLQPLQDTEPSQQPEPLQPLQDLSCKTPHKTLATIATKTTKKNLPRNLRRACAREGGANAGLEGKEASKRLDGAGLSKTEHSAAATWLRHVCGGSTPRSELAQRLATVRKYANPAYRWLKGHVALAGEIADSEGWYDQEAPRRPPPEPDPTPPVATDTRSSAEIVAAMSREISGKAYAPGGWVDDRNTQLDRLNANPRVKSAYLPREQLAARSMMERTARVPVHA